MTAQLAKFVSSLPMLAALSPDSAAYQTGFVAGRILGVVIFVVALIFSIVAIVKAFTKKTTGWIVAGSIGGAIMVLFALLFLAGIVVGFTKGIQKGIANVRERTVEPSSASIQPERITGEVLPFSIEKPSDWQLRRKQGAYDMILNNGENFVGVIAEEADLGGAENVAKLARKLIESKGAEVSFGENEQVVVDGRKWIAFTVKCKIQNLPFAYQYYVYSDKDGTIQIIGWTFQNLWDRNANKIRDVMKTFRFPAVKDAGAVKQ